MTQEERNQQLEWVMERLMDQISRQESEISYLIKRNEMLEKDREATTEALALNPMVYIPTIGKQYRV